MKQVYPIMGAAVPAARPLHVVLLQQHVPSYFKRPAASSDGIDIETKAKRSFDLPIFSISKWNERTCSKKIKIEKERIKTFQHFFEAKVKKNGMFQKL